MTLLAIDIGNTNIKTGLFLNEELSSFNIFKSIEEAKRYIASIEVPDKAAISSVVPAYTNELIEFLKIKLSCSPLVISHESKFNIGINYETPRTLGIDRICSCEGALSLFNQIHETPKGNYFIITADLGTATTVNIVKNGTDFIGGIIAPGLFTMANSLNKNTAQLPKIEFNEHHDLIGTSTVKSIESGIINSTIGLFYMTFEHLYDVHSAADIFFFITGGNAKYITPYIRLNYIYVEELVIQGIKKVSELN